MITVDQKERIRRAYFLQRKSIRAIAREFGHSRKTVRKAVTDSDVPVYEKKHPRRRRVLDPVAPIIDAWLEQDQRAPRKQRHTARRIYRRLKEEYDFSGGESSVRRYVRRQRKGVGECFIPLGYEPGSVAQIDWGEAVFELDGRETVAHLFCAKLMASGRLFVVAFPHQRQEAFWQGHVDFFGHIEGVPHALTYDNLKSAVLKVLQGRQRQEQAEFVALRSHYLFEGNFCNRDQGHEKGGVENLVGYVRRNVFVPLPRVRSWEELNLRLQRWCEGEDERLLQSPGQAELWEQEHAALLPLPARAYEACRIVPVRVDKQGRVCFDRCWYSVPARYVHRQLICQGYVQKVAVFSQRERVAEHRRLYTPGAESLDPVHYFPLLEDKPRAWRQARALRGLKLPAIFDQYCHQLEQRDPGGAREFIRILRLLEQVPQKALAAALQQALKLVSSALKESAICCAKRSKKPGLPRLSVWIACLGWPPIRWLCRQWISSTSYSLRAPQRREDSS